MGCDIHMYMERKVGKVWEHVAQVIDVDECCGEIIRDVPSQFKVYSERNYILFSVLAGVRSPFPQYDCKFEEKGFPKNASKEVRELYNVYGEDAHSASYITLKEFNEVWHRVWILREFRVTKKQKDYVEFLRNKKIEQDGHFEKGVWISKYEKPYVLDFWMYGIIKDTWESPIMSLYADDWGLSGKTEELLDVMYPVMVEDILEDFHRSVIFNKLEQFRPKTNPENLRLVFWFDN